MDALDALAVLRQQHADFEDDKLTSDHPHLTIVIESQQKELAKHILYLENAVQAREIAQVDLSSLQIMFEIRFQEQQALDNRYVAARQTGHNLDLTSVQTQMRAARPIIGHISPDYIRAASQPLLVGLERLLSETTLLDSTVSASPIDRPHEQARGKVVTQTIEAVARDNTGHERLAIDLRSGAHLPNPTNARSTPTILKSTSNATTIKDKIASSKLTTMKLGPKSCIACCEDTNAVHRLDMECGHSYCKACLVVWSS